MLSLLSFYLLCCALTILLTSSLLCLPQEQYDYLKEFHYSLGGENWVYSVTDDGIKWNFTSGSDPCLNNWKGINCEQNNCSISEIRYSLSEFLFT